jgi:hypothetical protein
MTVTTRKERHSVRPPVRHNWSLPGGSNQQLKKPFVFQHELLQNFSVSLFCKTPVQKVQKYSDLRDVLMRRIVLSTLQFRVNTRYKVCTKATHLALLSVLLLSSFEPTCHVSCSLGESLMTG